MEFNCDQLVSLIEEKYSGHKKFLNKALIELSDEEKNDLNSYIKYCTALGLSLEFLAESYLLIVNDTFKEQVYFQRHNRYRFSTYSEVASSVYHNPEYMKKYMVGLALSTFFWGNHRVIHRFFVDNLPTESFGKYLEVGPGHGFFFMSAMRKLKFDLFTGIDISKTSVEMTSSILDSKLFGEFENFEIVHSDFMNFEAKHKYDFLVMSEVLEHVESPLLFLSRLKKYSNKGACFFITTCINAPAIDHIYLYKTQEDVRGQVVSAGFTIKKELWLPYEGLSLEESQERKLPVNLAMVLM